MNNSFQNMTQFQTLQTLVARRMPDGREIPVNTATASLAKLLPFVIANNLSSKKILMSFGEIKTNDAFFQEWKKETEETDRLVEEAIKIFGMNL